MTSTTRLLLPCGADLKQRVAACAAAAGVSEETWLRLAVEAAVEQAEASRRMHAIAGISIEPAANRKTSRAPR